MKNHQANLDDHQEELQPENCKTKTTKNIKIQPTKTTESYMNKKTLELKIFFKKKKKERKKESHNTLTSL